ncbi:MAG: AI-2E family transporter [Bacteroidota bacterium]|nr:AI-2E family transporter [Bacteroidota bacterium]MDP4211066.1 AI-2E family transporter [Bacteroidota bacterium]MDP4249199.1 AI-2E family transporter [Bacteroidota bacterium]
MDRFNVEKVRQFFFLAILVLIGLLLFSRLQGFLPSFLGAVTFYVLMRKYMKHLLIRKWKPWAAALILMLVSFLIIMLPVYFLVNTVSSKVGYAISHAQEITSTLLVFLRDIESRVGYHFLNEETVRNLTGMAIQELPLILGATFNSVLALFIMYFLLYFMLTNCHVMEDWLDDVLPLRRDNLVKVQKEVNNMVVSNAVGVPLVAFVQGIAGLIIYLIVGVPEPFLWFALTGFASLIPVLGAALAYIPLSIILFVGGETAKGFIILIYGLLVVGTIDNVFRFWLQKKIGDVHPLITVFGVIVGVQLFGFIGIVFGPLLISLFILLMRIYYVEFIAPDKRIAD